MRLPAAFAFSLLLFGGIAHAEPIRILAAENFYGEAAIAIGGDHVSVESVIVAPGTDPHDFEPSPAVARAVADADIVIMNGAGYDHWIEDLIAATNRPERVVINVATLAGHGEGDNPHVWYDPKAMPALAAALADELAASDPGNAAGYAERRDAFLATLAPIAARVAAMKERFAGTPVVATEPVFGHMADAIGLVMQNAAFQHAIMNETEPAARDVAAMEDAIRNGTVRAVFYNAQVEDAFTRNIASLAAEAGVPLIPVTETQPEGQTFADWLVGTLAATERALADGAS